MHGLNPQLFQCAGSMKNRPYETQSFLNFCILALGSGQRLLAVSVRVRVRVSVSVSFSFTEID